MTEKTNENRERFITERIHEKRDRKLEARVLEARERLENAEIPLYQRVLRAQEDQKERLWLGLRW